MSESNDLFNTAQGRSVIDSLSEIADLLDLDLNRETLGVVTSLTEQGINPEALASVIDEIDLHGQT